MRRTGLLADSFFEGVEEFVEFEELFVHVDGGCLELLDFLGAVGKDEGQGRMVDPQRAQTQHQKRLPYPPNP